MTYFSPEPKHRREDFFDMDRELQEFLVAMRGGKLVVVSGFRRYGKTSLILTGLNEAAVDYVFLDCRLLPSGAIALDDLRDLLEAELNKRSWARRVLRGVEGISIGDVSIRFREKGQDLLIRILERLKDKVLVIDEAQELRRLRARFDSLLAYAYDHLDVKVVLSGSYVGLLHRFLREDDTEAPLFGRAYTEVKVGRLDREKGREFLMEGFRQEGAQAPREEIERALDKFDGVIGWLTHFGFASTKSGEPVASIFDKASRLAVSEVTHALKMYGVGERRYKEVLRIIASLETATWSEVKRGVEARLGRTPNNALSRILRNLVDLGFIEKDGEGYRVSEPVLKNGISKFL